LVAVLISKGPTVEQFVMSCRVIGLGVENAAVEHHIRRGIERGFEEIRGGLVPTNANRLAQDLWRRLGFVEEMGAWALSIGRDGGPRAVAVDHQSRELHNTDSPLDP
jgi:predicted enzyme involved in methoxymalonyl-ACP biosynthesis